MTVATGGSWRPSDTLANRFRLLRAELDMSQREFAARCGMTASQVQSIEDGKSPRALDVKVTNIARALGVDRDWLMWGGELQDPHPDGPDGDGQDAPDEDGLVALPNRMVGVRHLFPVADLYQLPAAG